MPDLCPLWGDTPVTTLDEIDENGVLFVYSPRAGGVYGLTGEWRRRGLSSPIDQRIGASKREKANLSHWIYCQNRDAGLLWPLEGMSEWDREDAMVLHIIDPKLLQQAPRLDPETVAAQSARTPSALDRRLTLLRELLRQQDIPRSTDENKLYRVCRDYEGLRAAAAAWETDTDTDSEAEEFWVHLEKEGWVSSRPAVPAGKLISLGLEHGELLYNVPAVCTLDARLWVEEHTRRESLSQQGFIAMWFNEDIRKQIAPTIEGAIQDAGYTPLLIIRDLRTHSIPDQIVFQLRQSRFVVADLTSRLLDDNDELGRRNVYYEAGFAAGADLEVIFTCREDCYDDKKVASDIRHFNVVCWDDRDLESFRQELQARILARVRPGRDHVDVNAADR